MAVFVGSGSRFAEKRCRKPSWHLKRFWAKIKEPIPTKWKPFVSWSIQEFHKDRRDGWLDVYLRDFGFKETLDVFLIEDWYTWLCSTGRNDVKLMVMGKLPIPWWVHETGVTDRKEFHEEVSRFIAARASINPPEPKSSLLEPINKLIWHPAVGRICVLAKDGTIINGCHEFATIGDLIHEARKSPWRCADKYAGMKLTNEAKPDEATMLFRSIDLMRW